MSPEEVVNRFIDGRPGVAKTITSMPVANDRYTLVGYGHAVYAIRHNDEYITRFEGWRERSKTSSRHIGYLDGEVDFDKPRAPTTIEILGVIDRSEV